MIPFAGIIVGAVANSLGNVVGTVLGSAAEQVVRGEPAPLDPKPVVKKAAEAAVVPDPKPLIKSKTLWFNMAWSVTVALISWADGYDWTSMPISPTTAVIIQGGANVLLRVITWVPIGRG